MSNEIPRVLDECSVNEKYLLEEYRDQGLCWRHDDDVFAKLTAVLLPLSIAALTLPYFKDGVPKLLAASGGLTLMAFWILSSKLYSRRLKIRFSRIHEIERILGFDSHLRYDRKTNPKVWKAQLLRYCMFGVYLVTALSITCDIKVEATDPKVKIAHSVAQFIRVSSNPKVETALWTIDLWPPFGLWSTDAWIIKLVITTETFAFLIIIVAVVIAVCIWILICIGWRYFKKRRDEKRWKRSPKGHSNPSEINASNTDYQ